jgi:glycosidase
MKHPAALCTAALLLANGCGGSSPATPEAQWPPAPRVVAAPPVSAPGLDGWANGAVVYEVFVRSFKDSNGDGKGDLQGLIEKLDYLNDGDPTTSTDLGVDAIWLMPIFASPSYHGYDTSDYETVNPDYGTNADLDALITAAHARGIKVLLDLVLNHTSSRHPWFTDSASGPASSYRDWYVWSATDLGWPPPWSLNGASTWHAANGADYYGVFGGSMPDLNYRNQAVRDEVKRIAALWLNRGIDGFRLDAARYLVENGGGTAAQDQPETHAFWKELSAWVRSVKPDATLVGEVWATSDVIGNYYGDTSALPGGDELPLLFDFPLASAMISAASSGLVDAFASALVTSGHYDPPGATLVPFLTNHDQIRVATVLGVDTRKRASAAGLLLTLPGTPFVYYGEEVGLKNGTASGDPAKRSPMPWTNDNPGGGFTSASAWYPFSPGRDVANVAIETGDPASLLSVYRGLIRARHASGALARGDLRMLVSTGSTLAWLRTTAVEQVLVTHNLGDTPLAVGPLAVTGASSEVLWASTGAKLTGGTGAWTAELPAHGIGVWRVE